MPNKKNSRKSNQVSFPINKFPIKKERTYTLTETQIQELKSSVIRTAVNEVFFLMLALPCEVLANEGYWEKDAKERMPKFIDDILSLYAAYEDGVVTMEQMEKDLYEMSGIRIQEVQPKKED